MSDEFVKVAKQSDVPEGSVKVFTVGGRRIVMCNVDKSFFAVADLCSHDNGPLGEGELFDHQIECPRHGARFDIKTGKAMCLPAVTPIPAYSVEIRGDDLWVSLPLKAGSEAKK
jgi:3-phenylpropionate/trans-cinnamate dioxygenase ferredoxin subunit